MPTHCRRITFTSAAALFGLAFLTPSTSAQTADEIVARYLEARGGLQKIRALESIRMKGAISFGPGEPLPFALEMKRPNRMRTEFTSQGMIGVQAFDGKRAWAVLPMAGKTEPEYLPAEASREASEQADIEGPLVDAAAKGNKVELLGREQVDGQDCFKLMITLKSGAVRYVFIDSKSFLEAKGEGRRMAGGDEVMLETYYRDYRDVSGIMLPFLIEAGPKEKPARQKIVLAKIEVNVPIEDRRFERPAERRP